MTWFDLRMRIGVNLQTLDPGAIGGMESYVRSLVEWIPGIDRGATLVLFCAERNAGTFAPGPTVEVHLLTDDEFARLDAAALDEHRLDVWFCPLLTLDPPAPGLPSVVTIPDVQHEYHPDFFTPAVLEWRRREFGRTVAAADRILTISHASKRQILDVYGVPERKVVVTHLDASKEFATEPIDDPAHLDRVRARYDLPDRYVVYPANDWPHKNHIVAFEALARFRRRGVEPPMLVLTGARTDPPPHWAPILRRLGLRGHVRHLGFVPARDLPAIYARADALVFPSLFEGFGIPVVEAMRSQCPVICADRTSLPEIGGDAVLTFDPSDPDELFELMWRVYESGPPARSELRRELVAAGVERSRAFSWRTCARATLAVLRDVARVPAGPVELTNDAELPSISIVTPSLDQGRFIERTLRSVLDQGYPDVQHLVVDGGSTDDTLDVLDRYQREHPGHLDYVSEPDRGQSHAVNKGLDKASGDIVGWLNSDDTLEPGALHAVAAAFLANPSWEVVYGNAAWIDEHDVAIAPYPTDPHLVAQALADDCPVCQPTVFFRRSVIDRGVRLDETLQWCMDYELWLRLIRETPFRFVDRPLANSRLHNDTKTVGSRHEVYREIFAVAERHQGRVPARWVLGRAAFRSSPEPTLLHPPPLGPSVYRRALVDLVRANLRHPAFLWRELTRGARREWMRVAVRRGKAAA